MGGTLQLSDFITLGQQLYVLMNPQNVDVVASELGNFRQSLRLCGLHRTSTAAETLSQIENIPYDLRSGLVSDVARLQLKAYLEPIFRTLYAEVGEQVAVSINVGVVSQQLRMLPSRKTLTATQTDLLNETVMCIECGAYRAGVVMAWNLAYDYVRQWVFDNHLARFNDKLTTQFLRRDGKPVFDPIVDYSDFCTGKPGERDVIDTCFNASLIGEQVREYLRFYLRRRNSYAHPTFTSPSADQTNAYVKDLLDTITAAPFEN